VIDLLQQVNARMIIIDEIHNLLAGSTSKLREYLNVIKGIGNELQIPNIVAGTREALRALNTDHQLGNWFEPICLPRWQNDDEYLQLLASYESILPLKDPSDLTDQNRDETASDVRGLNW
jgi:hypothetical protein